jgi:predicted RNase H-like nuclease (RuvC/YqgF family)
MKIPLRWRSLILAGGLILWTACSWPACAGTAAAASRAEIPPAAESGSRKTGSALPFVQQATAHAPGSEPQLRGESPRPGPLPESLRALEERMDDLNRKQRQMLRQIEALRRENRRAALKLSRKRREIVIARARPTLEEIRSARQEWENLRKTQQAAAGRFRHHRRKLDWDAALHDLSVLVRCGQLSVEQLERELAGELKLKKLLSHAGAP